MPKIDIQTLPVATGTDYPAPYNAGFERRHRTALGDPMGLTQFGVNHIRLKPGGLSSLRHWHEEQDEFLVVTEGRLTLIEDSGETELAPGDCAAFPKGAANGHHLANKAGVDGCFVVVGARTRTERVWYSDVDMTVSDDETGGGTFTRQDGSPIERDV